MPNGTASVIATMTLSASARYATADELNLSVVSETTTGADME
jgi:hypothetical protein